MPAIPAAQAGTLPGPALQNRRQAARQAGVIAGIQRSTAIQTTHLLNLPGKALVNPASERPDRETWCSGTMATVLLCCWQTPERHAPDRGATRSGAISVTPIFLSPDTRLAASSKLARISWRGRSSSSSSRRFRSAGNENAPIAARSGRANSIASGSSRVERYGISGPGGQTAATGDRDCRFFRQRLSRSRPAPGQEPGSNPRCRRCSTRRTPSTTTGWATFLPPAASRRHA